MVVKKMSKRETQNNSTSTGGFSQSSNTQGIKAEDLIQLMYGDQAVTSSFTISRLFSLKQRKFIKPFKVEKYFLIYKVLPGTYIKIYCKHHKSEEVMNWIITVFKIYRNEKGETEEKTLKEVKWITPTERSKISVPILRDIVRPAFHGHSGVLYDTIYSEQDVEELLKGGIDPSLQNDIE
jgi:hypothetical protein